MPRKKPFSVKQKKKQLQDKRERKRGQCGSGGGGGTRAPAHLEGGVCLPHLWGGVGGGVGSRGSAWASAEGIPPFQRAPPCLEGMGKDEELGEGSPSSSNGAPSQQFPGRVTTPTHTRRVLEREAPRTELQK